MDEDDIPDLVSVIPSLYQQNFVTSFCTYRFSHTMPLSAL